MTNSLLYLFLVLGCWFSSCPIFAFGDPDYANYEYKLRQVLYGNRKPIDLTHRPSLYSNQSTELEFGLSLIGIVDVNAAKNSLVLSMWVRAVWNDYTLHWNVEEFGRINVLRLPPKFIWIPDIILENSAEASQSEIDNQKCSVLVYPDGMILWVPTTTYSLSCAIDLYKFPFDSHLCSFLFRSWSVDGNNLILKPYGYRHDIDFSDYANDNEWDVKDAAKEIVYFEVKEHAILQFGISLKRRPYFYILTLIIPVFLSWILMLVIFWLPLWSNQRIFLSSLTVVYLEILTIHLHWVIPNNASNVPIIVLICGRSTIFAAVLLVFSVALITMIKTPDPPRLPFKLKNVLCRWLSYVLCVKRINIPEVFSQEQLLNGSSVKLNVDKIDQNEVFCDWLLLMTILNRLVFIIYFFLFASVFLVISLLN